MMCHLRICAKVFKFMTLRAIKLKINKTMRGVMMADYGEILKRPFTDIKKLLIGILLSLIPIVNFFAGGFQAKAAKLVLQGKKQLPEWTDWGDLFVTGLLITIIGIIWLIPAGILFMIFGGMAFFGAFAPGMAPAGAFATAGLGIIIAALVLIVSVYIMGAAVMNYIAKGNFGAAFAFGEIFKKAFTGAYLVAWLVGIILTIVLTAILQVIPWIGTAISGFISGMWYFMLIASAFKESK